MISGLTYVPNFISHEEEINLINHIDSQHWLTDLKRRTQHYGYKYDYTKKTVDKYMYLGDLPIWLKFYCYKLLDAKYFWQLPDQVIINEYLPGQGISKHVDCIPCFGQTVASLSLGSTCVMDFEHIQTHQKGTIGLAPLSLLVLKDEARYDWMHAIPARKEDIFGDMAIPRRRRISLTFRIMILN